MDSYRSSYSEDHQLSFGGSSSRYRTARSHTIAVVMPSTASVAPSPPSLLPTLTTRASAEEEPETAPRAKVNTANATRQSLSMSNKKPAVRLGHEPIRSSYATARMMSNSHVEQKISPTSRNPRMKVADLYDANTHIELALSLRVEHLRAMEEAHRQAEKLQEQEQRRRRGERANKKELLSDAIEEEAGLVVVGCNDDDGGAAFRGRRKTSHEGSFSSTVHGGGTCCTISDVCAAIPSTDPDEFFVDWSKQGTTRKSKKKGGPPELHYEGHAGSSAHDHRKEADRSNGQPRSLKAKQTHLHAYLSQLRIHVHDLVGIEGGKPSGTIVQSSRSARKREDDDDDTKEGDFSAILYEGADSVALKSANAFDRSHSSGGGNLTRVEPSPLSVRTQQSSSFSSHAACTCSSIGMRERRAREWANLSVVSEEMSCRANGGSKCKRSAVVEDDGNQSYADRRNSSLKTHYYPTKRMGKKLVDTTIRDGTLTEEVESQAAELGHCSHSRDLDHRRSHHYCHDRECQSITNDGSSRRLSSPPLGPPSLSSASPHRHHQHKKQYSSSFVSDNSIADETVPVTKMSDRPNEYKHKHSDSDDSGKRSVDSPTRRRNVSVTSKTQAKRVVGANESSSSSSSSSYSLRSSDEARDEDDEPDTEEEAEEEEPSESEDNDDCESIAVEKGCDTVEEEGSSIGSTSPSGAEDTTPPSSSSSSSSGAGIVDEDDDGVDWDASGSGYSSSSSSSSSSSNTRHSI